MYTGLKLRPLRLVGADIYPDAVGQAWADAFVQAPLTSGPDYLGWLRSVVDEHRVDLIIPGNKQQLVENARNEVIKVEQQYLEGAITNGERYNKIIAVWSEVTEKIADEMFGEMGEMDRAGRNFNPVFIMAASGARGSKQQIRQLAGMRGLMANPKG